MSKLTCEPPSFPQQDRSPVLPYQGLHGVADHQRSSVCPRLARRLSSPACFHPQRSTLRNREVVNLDVGRATLDAEV